MANEETEKTMRFILEQQAQFAADIMQIKDVQAQFALDMKEIQDVQAQFALDMREMKEIQAQSVKDIQQLRETEITVMRGLTTVLGIVGQLGEAQKNTDARVARLAERIDAFIAALRNGQKGTS